MDLRNTIKFAHMALSLAPEVFNSIDVIKPDESIHLIEEDLFLTTPFDPSNIGTDIMFQQLSLIHI